MRGFGCRGRRDRDGPRGDLCVLPACPALLVADPGARNATWRSSVLPPRWSAGAKRPKSRPYWAAIMGAVISTDRPGPNSLHQALRERALERVELVMKVALLVGAGFSGVMKRRPRRSLSLQNGGKALVESRDLAL
jgi:hypothetical protein